MEELRICREFLQMCPIKTDVPVETRMKRNRYFTNENIRLSTPRAGPRLKGPTSSSAGEDAGEDGGAHRGDYIGATTSANSLAISTTMEHTHNLHPTSRRLPSRNEGACPPGGSTGCHTGRPQLPKPGAPSQQQQELRRSLQPWLGRCLQPSAYP